MQYSLSFQLARWLDARLHDLVCVPVPSVRLYGLEIIDRIALATLDPTAVRVVFVLEADDHMALLASPDAERALQFDAAATVDHRWLPAVERPPRPGAFTGRRRARVVTVTTPTGSTSLARFDDAAEPTVLSNAA